MPALENSVIETMTPLIEKKLATLGLELYELKCIAAGSRLIIRVFIDKEGSVTVDDCEKASNEISILFDVEEITEQSYTLEVSSPGLDRRLMHENDFRRVIGNTVRIHYSDEEGKNKTLSGKLITCADGSIGVETKRKVTSISIDAITKGKIEIKI